MSDKLEVMWEQQEGFMKLLQEKRSFPQFPIDLKEKNNQKFVKTIIFEAMGELFEFVQELKNAKSHRATEINDLDHEALVEEMADVQHYINEVLILLGVTPHEFFVAYMKKGEKNDERIRNGY